MGKVTGFLEYERIEEGYAPVPQRLKHYKEFVIGLAADQAKVQGARCMDCGTPFCNNGCPVNNVIPDFNDLVYRGIGRTRSPSCTAPTTSPSSPAASAPRPAKRPARSTSTTTRWASSPSSTRSSTGLGRGLGQATARGGEDWQEGGRGRLRPGRLAAAQQLARAGHAVTVFEKNDRAGGLLRYGIPDFKMEKSHIDRRVARWRPRAVVFRTGVMVGELPKGSKVTNWAKSSVSG
jgi:glutamate synthase (NADPH/NADH) small chain